MNGLVPLRDQHRDDMGTLSAEAAGGKVGNVVVLAGNSLHPLRCFGGYFVIIVVDHVGNRHHADAGFLGDFLQSCHTWTPFSKEGRLCQNTLSCKPAW